MSAPDYYPAFRRAVLTRRVGSIVTADHIRDELEAAQIPGSALGGLFRHAAAEGLLATDGRTIPALPRTRRGGRVLAWVRQPARRTERAA